MSAAPLADWGTLGEDERIHTWRLCRLLDLGYGMTQAEELAADGTDVHQLEELVVRGCPLDLAARILAPLEQHPRVLFVLEPSTGADDAPVAAQT